MYCYELFHFVSTFLAISRVCVSKCKQFSKSVFQQIPTNSILIMPVNPNVKYKYKSHHVNNLSSNAHYGAVPSPEKNKPGKVKFSMEKLRLWFDLNYYFFQTIHLFIICFLNNTDELKIK